MYRFSESLNVTNKGTQDIVQWMQQRKETLKIENVEGDRAYQKHDIDIIWVTQSNINLIEIKVDRYAKTGNFFFETISNKEKNTPGCFLYTKANLIFYYFLDTKILYTLPMPTVRDWFLERQNSFKERSTTTPLKNGNYYTTVGRLIPISQITQALPTIRRICLAQQ
jgi:hypothetical protein